MFRPVMLSGERSISSLTWRPFAPLRVTPIRTTVVEYQVRVAEGVPRYPLFLNKIPQLTGYDLSPPAVREIVRRCPNAAGVPSAVSGHANPCPELFVELFEAIWRGDTTSAASARARVQSVRRILKDGGDTSLLKAVLSYRGVKVGSVRAPLLNTPDDAVDSCLRALADRGIALTRV